jgi:hypothetical protein
LRFYEGLRVQVGVLQIEESELEVLCTNSTALFCNSVFSEFAVPQNNTQRNKNEKSHNSEQGCEVGVRRKFGGVGVGVGKNVPTPTPNLVQNIKQILARITIRLILKHRSEEYNTG